jgi:1,4-dihydroxy-2-naphthoate octaprenyltransferase
VGAALAFEHEGVDAVLFLLTLLGAVLVQVGTNLVDEYADHAKGQSGGGSEKFPAPYRVIALGLLSPGTVRAGAVAAFAGATAIGAYIVAVSGWPILAACIASLAVAYLYSGGPMPLGRMGLGQPLVFFFMGPLMVAGTWYVQTRTLTWDALWLSLPVGFLVTAILVVNDLRDLEEDQGAGKTTPVTLWGRPFGQGTYLALVSGAFLVVALLVAAAPQRWPLLAVALAAPQALGIARLLRRGTERAAFNQALRRTAQLHLQFGLLLASGLVGSRLLQG